MTVRHRRTISTDEELRQSNKQGGGDKKKRKKKKTSGMVVIDADLKSAVGDKDYDDEEGP